MHIKRDISNWNIKMILSVLIVVIQAPISQKKIIPLLVG